MYGEEGKKSLVSAEFEHKYGHTPSDTVVPAIAR